MTDRNDGRPKHSASHMHCAVPFFCARSGTEGEAAWRSGEWVVRAAGVHRAVGGRASVLRGEQKCSGGACRCAGASGGLRWGRCCEGGGACIAQPAGGRRHCVGERKCSGRACRCVGWAKSFGGGERRSSAGNASRSLRACVGVAWGSGSARRGRALCVGERRSSAGNGL